MKETKSGFIEDTIPAFLNLSKPKCRFILKRVPPSWRGMRVEIMEVFEDEIYDIEARFDTLISQGRNEIDHSNHELFLFEDPRQMLFCFESSRWARINRL